jgi:hypothetical protein
MARTITQIADTLKASFVADSELANRYGLDQTKSYDEQFSRASIEGIIIYVIASAIRTLELICDTFRTDVDTLLRSQYLTSLRYYHDKALSYQHGDALSYNSTTYQVVYAAIDASKQVVKYAAVKSVEPTTARSYIDIKVSGVNKTPLTTAQLDAFKAYMAQVGAAGTRYVIASDTPRECYFHIDVKYDPVVIQNTTAGRALLVSAIADYLNNLDYGGLVIMSDLTAKLSALSGVKAVYISYMHNVYEDTDYTQATVESDTGAFVLDANQQDSHLILTV